MGLSWQEYWMSCHFLLQGIFLTQESNPCLLSLLHWQVESLPLSHLGRLAIKCLTENSSKPQENSMLMEKWMISISLKSYQVTLQDKPVLEFNYCCTSSAFWFVKIFGIPSSKHLHLYFKFFRNLKLFKVTIHF